MIRRIILDNYMSHRHTVIEPAEGLTVLIGPNNCGKSAVIHALEMICYNAEAADFAIRHGAKKATVTIETEDASGARHTIVWWRKKQTCGYIIDGREISGVGRALPDDLHDHLRMPRIESADKPFYLHFGLQKDPIFLLNDSAGRAAQFFASSSDADKLLEMQRLHASKTSDRKREKLRLDGEIKKLDESLAALAPLDDLKPRVSAAERQHEALCALAEQIKELDQATGEFAKSQSDERDWYARHRALSALRTPPDLANTTILRQHIKDIETQQQRATHENARGQILGQLRPEPTLHVTTDLSALCRHLAARSDDMAREQARANALGKLAPHPSRHDTDLLRGDIDALDHAASDLRRRQATRGSLETLRVPPKRPDTTALAKLIHQLNDAHCLAEKHRHHEAVLAQVTSPPALGDSRSLSEQIDALSSAASNVNRASSRVTALEKLQSLSAPRDAGPFAAQIKAIAAAQAELRDKQLQAQRAQEACDELRQQIEQWVRENPRCTACGQTLSADLIYSRGHAHG